jgi:hypothetical protein
VARWIVNFLMGGIWVLVFNALGWITLSAQPHTVADPALGHLLDAALIGFVIALAGEVGSFLYVLFVVATLGLGCLLLPFYWLLIGYFKLWLAAAVLPGWFDHTHNLLFVIIMSWILGASRWHSARELQRRPAAAGRDPREVQAEWREVDDRRLPPP